MQLYAITDRQLFARPEGLIKQVALWAEGGVDFIQIREKDLTAAELAELTTRLVRTVRTVGSSRTRVLLNGPAQMAAETGCDGIHLTADHPPSTITEVKAAIGGANPVVSVSCHTLWDIERARDHSGTLAIFAPVFEKRSGVGTIAGQGLDALSAACQLAGPMPLFALGGVNAENADVCIRAGAAGIAAIRLFVSPDWRKLRR